MSEENLRSEQPPPPGGELLLYQTEDGHTHIECRFAGETIWLTQRLMADLFQTSISNVTQHLKAVKQEKVAYPQSSAIMHECGRYPLSTLHELCYCGSMAITEQIADFTAFARLLAQQEGDNISLDDVYQQWKEIDSEEVAILQNRLDSYDAGERGQTAVESMDELRKRLLTKFGK